MVETKGWSQPFHCDFAPWMVKSKKTCRRAGSTALLYCNCCSTTVLFFLHGDMFFWSGQPHRAEPDLDLKEIMI